jgi:hypothetical protein
MRCFDITAPFRMHIEQLHRRPSVIGSLRNEKRMFPQ